MPAPPKLPYIGHTGNFRNAAVVLPTRALATVTDTWKPGRREIATLPANTKVQVIEDVIVVQVPDVIRVTRAVDELHLKSGDEILRFGYLGEGPASFWAEGCWYENANLDFVTEPDGGGCVDGEHCAAKVTKIGAQNWWVHVKLPDGRQGWTLTANLGLAD